MVAHGRNLSKGEAAEAEGSLTCDPKSSSTT